MCNGTKIQKKFSWVRPAMAYFADVVASAFEDAIAETARSLTGPMTVLGSNHPGPDSTPYQQNPSSSPSFPNTQISFHDLLKSTIHRSLQFRSAGDLFVALWGVGIFCGIGFGNDNVQNLHEHEDQQNAKQ